MRLIDADAFISELEEDYQYYTDEVVAKVQKQETAYDAESVIAQIRNIRFPSAGLHCRVLGIIMNALQK